ncbi:hypothetical protein [Vibrio parahaemolyticus]|uniref:hypothetical protein n=1 Tax=Vibrio parahaemolyticus TaxID=670 RepID=UPI00226B597E|nr:hypothetical protein [Vibrio parahaemolyticus]MCX8941261.1 hypothetical protein [Vibrio parahaemolyticus]
MSQDKELKRIATAVEKICEEQHDHYWKWRDVFGNIETIKYCAIVTAVALVIIAIKL